MVELDHVIACGDGYVDEVAGEVCDPTVPSSYVHACKDTSRPLGTARCDPDTCEIIDTSEQCAFCGDGILDAAAGEECDGLVIPAQCPGEGHPTCDPLTCRISLDTCAPCGNGEIDPGEECDPGSDRDDLAAARLCAGNDDYEPLRSPYDAKPYTSGTAVGCLDDCTFDRRGCGYCGDGTQDDASLVSIVDAAFLSLPEACDGEDFDPRKLASDFPECAQLAAQPNVTCDDDCLGVTRRRGDPCCLPSGATCEDAPGATPCCLEYTHPGLGDACVPMPLPESLGGDREVTMLCR